MQIQQSKKWIFKVPLSFFCFEVSNFDRYADSKENLLNVAERGDVDKFREMLNKENDLNIIDNSGWTPLHNTAKKRYLEVAEVLLNYRADSNANENTGLTPLYLAMQYG